MNTVDVIFPSWPLWLYTNITIGKYLLLPLFDYQETGQYPNAWSVHDMGLFLFSCCISMALRSPMIQVLPTPRHWDTMMVGLSFNSPLYVAESSIGDDEQMPLEGEPSLWRLVLH